MWRRKKQEKAAYLTQLQLAERAHALSHAGFKYILLIHEYRNAIICASGILWILIHGKCASPPVLAVDLLCKQSYFAGLDPLCVSPSSSVCFSVEGDLKTRSSTCSVSLSDAVINTHTAVLRLSDDVILSAAVLLILERGGKLGWVLTCLFILFPKIIIGFISYINVIICFLQDNYSISLKA